ncbi:MAG TPA: proton-conducting transporter membrane subunit [Dehalococcoidia bacterium]
MTALALPLLPLATALLLVAVHSKPRLLAPLAVSGLIATLALGVWAAAREPAFDSQWSPAIEMQLSVEGFGRVMVVLVPLVATPIVAYAAATETDAAPRLLALMLAFVAAMLLLVSAADFLTLLIAWELVGAMSWALIAHNWRDPANVRSASQAFITTRFGDLGLYLAAGLVYAETGSFAFAGLAGVDRSALDAIAAGILLAAAAKSAQVPFSPWLFSAMAGPTPVSALLHSATLVAAGAYLLIRLSPALEPVDWFLPAVAGTGLATALAGGIVATIQTHAKRILAGSTSAQYGLMFIAVGASSTAAAGAQLVAHAAFKSLLFLSAGVAIHAAGAAEVRAMRLGRAIPLVAALSLAGVLALAAVPPIGGAWTKEQIVSAATESSAWLAIGALAAGFLSALYATRYQLLVWGRDATEEGDAGALGGARRVHHRPGRAEVGSIAVLACITVLLSALWLPGARDVVEEATMGELFGGAAWEFVAATVLIAAAIVLARLMLQRGSLLSLGLSPEFQASAGDWLGMPAAARLLVVGPVLALSRNLAGFDNRVVDAGVRLAAALPAWLSRLFSLRAEWTIDGVVQSVARMTMLSADGSRLTDEAAIDGAVEGSARGIGVMGEASRRLQTGLSHHYYVLLALGTAAVVAALAVSL